MKRIKESKEEKNVLYRNEICFDESKRTATFEKYIYDLP